MYRVSVCDVWLCLCVPLTTNTHTACALRGVGLWGAPSYSPVRMYTPRIRQIGSPQPIPAATLVDSPTVYGTLRLQCTVLGPRRVVVRRDLNVTSSSMRMKDQEVKDRGVSALGSRHGCRASRSATGRRRASRTRVFSAAPPDGSYKLDGGRAAGASPTRE